MTDFGQPDKKRHPDGVHRNQHGHAIYIIPGEPHETKCTLCQRKVQGWPFQRTTTFISVLESTFGLEKWKLRQVVKGLTIKDHLQVKAAGSLDSDESLDRIAEQALEAADTSYGADMGTGVHGITEALDRGDDVLIPSSVKADVIAYQEMMAAHQLKPVEIEVNVALDGWRPSKTTRGISGRFDRIVEVNKMCPACKTNRFIFDLKTGKTVHFDGRKIPMQLATYALGKRYDASTGVRDDLHVCQCVGLVMHLPVGKGEATLYAADLAAGFQGIQIASQVWEWRSREGLLRSVPPPTDQTYGPLPDAVGELVADNHADKGAVIYSLIAAAQTVDTVREVWTSYAATAEWSPGHKSAALERVKELAK